MPPPSKLMLNMFSIFKAIEVDNKVIGTNINLNQKNDIFLSINSFKPQAKQIKKIRIDEAPNNLISKSEVKAPYFPRILLVALSEKYEKEGSFILNVIMDAAIIVLIIKRINPIASKSLFLKKGICV